jgi:hypothetical protein
MTKRILLSLGGVAVVLCLLACLGIAKLQNRWWNANACRAELLELFPAGTKFEIVKAWFARQPTAGFAFTNIVTDQGKRIEGRLKNAKYTDSSWLNNECMYVIFQFDANDCLTTISVEQWECHGSL